MMMMMIYEYDDDLWCFY